MNPKMKIYYFYDALCGWCYAFSPVIKEVYEENMERIDFEIISGGMIRGERVGPMSNMAEYILGAIPRVEELSGIQFGKPHIEVLKEGTTLHSSIEPSIALSVCKMFAPEKAIPFASAMQKAHFFDGKDYNDNAMYIEIAASLGIDTERFSGLLLTEEARYAAHQDFRLAEDFGISGFPACVAEKSGKYYLISRGFMKKEDFYSALAKVESIAV
ncbi:MAG: DsbA family protein [Ignavibacteriales bacterium]|nr:DsbA family protein [Ignavibacteriales bacterium]